MILEGSCVYATLKSSLKTGSSVKPAGIFATAEDDTAVQYPGEQVAPDTTGLKMEFNLKRSEF